jgi:hypothetical protein
MRRSGVRSPSAPPPTAKEYALHHPKLGVGIDVHWALTEVPLEASIDEAELWDRAETFEIAGRRVFGLAWEDLLAYICFHASHHHFFYVVGLRPFVDVVQICTHSSDLDWSAFVRRVKGWGWERGTYLTLSIAREKLGAPVSASHLDSLLSASSTTEEMCREALRCIVAGSAVEETGERNILRTLSGGSLRERGRFFARRLFPSRAQLIEEFGLTAREGLPPLAVLHLRRLLRLLPRYVPKLWRMGRLDGERREALRGRRRLIAWLRVDRPDPEGRSNPAGPSNPR